MSSSWKDLIIGTVKLTDEVKRLNTDVVKLEDKLIDVDKRVVRLETMVEMATIQKLPRK